ncbi:stress-induced protein [Enterococcus faecium]|uniref:stress-induced protein n=1 Tax=Enterococcus faecium TaxID=1352 RepID=UPI00339147E7
MANDKNLIPQSKRTKSERRKIAKKGGKASGKARRKKSDLRKALNVILTSEVSEKRIAKKLECMGLENTYEMAIMISLVNEALNGDISAVNQIAKLTGANKDRYDIAEQREKTKLLKNQNNQMDLADDTEGEFTVIIDNIPFEESERVIDDDINQEET